MRTCEVHVHVPAHSESIALQSEVHEGTLVYSRTDRIHVQWAHPVPHATERMHTGQCACVHTRAHRVPRTFSSCMWLQQCTRFCRCTLDFRGFCNGVHEMCTMRGVGSSVMQTTFLQARLPRVRSLTEKQKMIKRKTQCTQLQGPSDHPAKATRLAGAAQKMRACARTLRRRVRTSIRTTDRALPGKAPRGPRACAHLSAIP
jgi:hypothetical protein